MRSDENLMFLMLGTLPFAWLLLTGGVTINGNQPQTVLIAENIGEYKMWQENTALQKNITELTKNYNELNKKLEETKKNLEVSESKRYEIWLNINLFGAVLTGMFGFFYGANIHPLVLKYISNYGKKRDDTIDITQNDKIEVD